MTRYRRRREAEPGRLELLLDDPGTVHAAYDAFTLAERPDEPSWPFVASVGPDTVALRWAGTSVPEPAAPWRAGYDARVWIADRAELDAAAGDARLSATAGTAVLVGWFEDTVVFVNTSRAPGPIAVEGDEEGAALLHRLIAPQTPVPSGGSGPWWPMEVQGTAIRLLGPAVARVLAADQIQRAVESVRLATAMDVARRSEAEAAQAASPQTRAADELEAWLRQVAEAVALARFEAAEARAAAEPEPTQSIPRQALLAESVVEDDESVPMPATSSAGNSAPEPADQGLDELDDWSVGFAVSSAEEASHR